jgi:hypothetical protein
MAVKKAVAKKAVTLKPLLSKGAGDGVKIPSRPNKKPTKAKARVDAVEKKLDATFRKVAAEIDAEKPVIMGVSNVRRADTLNEVHKIDAANLVNTDDDEFGVGYMSFEESDALDKIEEENRGALKSRPDWSVNGSLPKKTRQHAELDSLKREIDQLKKDLAKTNALLLDSERKLSALMKPKEPWYITLFRTEERAG